MMLKMFISVYNFSMWLLSKRLQVHVRGGEISTDERTMWALGMLCSKAQW